MRLKSLLSSILVLVSVALSFFLYQYFFEIEEKNIQYHLSKWNEYSRQIDKAEAKGNNILIELNHVYGLVVPHHVPVTLDSLTDYYKALSKKQKVKNIVIIGPDHIDGGYSPVSVSAQKFVSVYGQLLPYKKGLDSVLSTGIASREERLFEDEHSIGVQVLLISKFFPNINILPIVIRSDITKEEAIRLGNTIATMLDEDTVLVASVDFSHYLSTSQAEMLDEISGLVVKDLDISSSKLVRADSSKSMLVFMQAMSVKGSKDDSMFKVLNTDDFMQNSDYTTGYVFGFWGVR